MNILYIDFSSFSGHKNFNKIHIESLQRLGAKIDMISKEGYASNFSSVNDVFSIPRFIYNYKGLIYYVLLSVYQFIIWAKFCKKHYDAVIVSTYETTTFWLMPLLNQRTYIINHHNVWESRIRLKKKFLQWINPHVTHIVFNSEIASYLTEINIKNKIHIVPHGLLKFNSNDHVEEVPDMANFVFNKFNYVVFCPSKRSVDIEFLNSLFCSEKFNKFIKESNIYFVVNGSKPFSNDNIISYDKYLTHVEYNFIFDRADFIFLPYKNNFQYRVSGIMFECFTKNKKCCTIHNKALDYYSRYFDYDGFIDRDVDSIITSWNYLINLKKCNFYKGLEKEDPTMCWKELFNCVL